MPPAGHRLGRVEFTLMVSAMMALTALGIDLMLPAFDEMRADLGLESDPTSISATVTAYFIGMAFGQIFFGLGADRFGRRPALYLGMAIYAAGAVASALSPTLGVLVAARLVWGLGAGATRAIPVALVRDQYRGPQMAQAMSYVMAVFIMVPVFAPSLGAVVASAAGWRWVFWICAVLAAVLAFWVLRLPETLRPEDRLDLGLPSVAGAMKRVVTTRVTGGYLVAITLMMAVFMSYLASSELIIGEIYGYDDAFPIIFGAVALALAVASFLNARIVVRYGVDNVVTGAWIVYFVAAAVLLVLTLFGDGVPSFWVFLFCLATLLSCHVLIVPNMNTQAMEPMGDIAGTASAVIGFVSIGVGALLGSLIDRGMETTITALAAGFFVVAVLVGGLVAWIRRGAPVEVGAAAVPALEPN